MRKQVNGLTVGFRTLFTGMRLIRQNSRIFRLAIIPFFIDFLILAGVFYWGSGRLSGWVESTINWMLPNASGFWYQLAYWPVFLVGWIAFFGALFFVGYIIANLVAAPFNSLLAETALEEMGVIKKRPFNFSRWLKISAAMFWAGLLKTALFLFFGILFFMFSFIPLLGILASFGLLMIMAFDSADYSFEILEYNLQRRLKFFRQNTLYFAGSGLSLGMTLMIPGLNFLLFPAAVVGSADLVRQRILLEEGSNHELSGSGS